MNKEKLQESTFNFAEGELLLINKPYEWTSFDVVGKIRNSLKPLKLKVGHAGTLDPLATGLLILCTGKLTKQIDTFQAQEKEYTGTMILGATTPSFDLETVVDQEFSLEGITADQIYAATAPFTGVIQQYPPQHSAVKVDGERSYLKARRGEETAVRLREVTVSEFEITRIALPEVDFRIVCSKGTYIRSLISDFGKQLHNGAYLSKLVRTRSGDFLLENAFEVADLVAYLRDKREKDARQTEAQ
ncbi:tRNA pseudouridine(55) synthase TruB [Pedobacter sp. MC2016-14]|uniref:tRNA pseudouridine(55) synthase TruB n=1 Tax=Pedobacter sp. MC2016-14 TaxID=2897327 RepID=UPI001E36B009|nr:tRNA pseudouridine(55) synthase TruB [Pedobacter sp. MC2016-14]MCD0488124.1 tRNA pseudouridine(55) synthase TruB [Pedobacter sp. MC2016-14]